MALSHSPSIVTDGLVLCLDAGNQRSYPGSGTTWRDLSGNGNHGTLVNGVGYSNDGGFIFDGVDDQIKILSNTNYFLFNTSDNITIENWIKSSNIQSQVYQAFFTIGGVPEVTRDRMIQVRLAQYSQYGHIDMLHRNANNTIWHILRTSVPVIENNNWYNIVITLTYGIGSTWKIYVNGVQVSTVFHSGNGNEAPIQPSDVSVYIGNGEDGTVEQFTGNIYLSKLYHKTLTLKEIQQNYNATKGRFGL